jgi:hypothetical protein
MESTFASIFLSLYLWLNLKANRLPQIEKDQSPSVQDFPLGTVAFEAQFL